MIYDTPGFTSFDIMEAGEDTLDMHYPEMAVYKGKCYYDDCRHRNRTRLYGQIGS